MAKPLRQQARFAVRSADGRRSGVWLVWKHKNRKKSDIFLASHNLSGALKISFHEYGETHEAFIREYFLQHRHKPGMPADRTRTQWPRQSNAEAGVALLYQLYFPHSELRATPLEAGLAEEDVIWIAASPDGSATAVDFLLVRPNEPEVYLEGYRPTTPWPAVHWFLPSGENLLLLPQTVELGAELISEAQRVADEIRDPPPDAGPNARMILALAPVNNVGATLDVAYPCTVASSSRARPGTAPVPAARSPLVPRLWDD